MHYRFVNIFMYRLQFMCQERSFMTGSLQLKGNRYYIVLNIYDDYGKRHKKWIKTEFTKNSKVH